MTTKTKAPPRKGRNVQLTKEQIAKYSQPSQAVAVREQPQSMSETAALIAAITKASRDPKVDISKMDWLLKTGIQLKKDQAWADYNDAMARVQARLEPVRRAALNPQTSSKYATEAALDDAIRPEYIREGFALEFDTEPIPDRDDRWVMVVCYCSRGGERRRHQIPMPCDGLGPKGTPVMSRTHATGSAFSYGRRYLRCGIFNVITADMAKQDDDGNKAGTYRPPPKDPQETGEFASEQQLAALRAILARAKVPVGLVLETFSINDLADLTQHQCAQAVKKANKKLELMFAEEKAGKAADKAAAADPDIFPGDRP